MKVSTGVYAIKRSQVNKESLDMGISGSSLCPISATGGCLGRGFYIVTIRDV
ncbi:MAG: hypothetical protein ACI9HK_000528, partial [Pirellulaceae bacterium]